MGIEAACAALVRVLLASGVAAPLAWAASSGLRGRCGPRAAYLAWACVPAAVAGALLPPAGIDGPAAVSLARIDLGMWEPDGTGAATGWPSFLLLAWLGGALACAGLLAWRQYRFQRALGPLHALGGRLFRAAAATAGLPAAIGLLRPRIVVPADFAIRYSPAERHLVLAHERAHLQRGDLWAHALAALLLCLHWFNPLMHAAMRRFRRDQELACDALVIARLRCTPRAYGAALLKAASIVPEYLPVACHWTCPHPLKERLAMLKHRPPSPRRLRAARLFAAGLAATFGCATWAQQPAAPGHAAAAATPATVDESDKALKPPRYPKQAVEQGISGEVVVLVDIDARGRPTAWQVETSWPQGVFDAAVLDAARGWRFVPARRHGKPVAGRVRVPVTFEAEGDASAPAHAGGLAWNGPSGCRPGAASAGAADACAGAIR